MLLTEDIGFWPNTLQQAKDAIQRYGRRSFETIQNLLIKHGLISIIDPLFAQRDEYIPDDGDVDYDDIDTVQEETILDYEEDKETVVDDGAVYYEDEEPEYNYRDIDYDEGGGL